MIPLWNTKQAWVEYQTAMDLKVVHQVVDSRSIHFCLPA